MTFWIVVGVLLAVLLAGTALIDHRARARGARVSGDVGQNVTRGAVNGNVDAYRGSDAQGHRTGGGFSGP
ncbi:hypothetical protein [Modestobacter italicus]|uniref:hypothetical protein n=1 Tax=Modestobacter italicus (strain DSM 44449 / CECT 9708 / BC 501) TaxID=2732864 RepID=UPI001C94BBC2|nr:hypothetical protein [Modestobacter italicus]